MAWTRCGKCGKRYPKGDKIAELAHSFQCKKSVVRGGLYLPKKK